MKIPTHLSWSQISSFLACPRSWYVSKILGEEQVSTSQAARGSAFDQMVSVKLGLANVKECAELMSLARSPEDMRKASRIDEAVEVYFANGGWSKAEQAQSEVRLSLAQFDTLKQIYDVPGDLWLPLVGYVDLLRTNPTNPFEKVLCDLKTSERAEYRPGWSGQCALYCLCIGASEFEIHLVCFTKSIKLVKYAYRPTDKTFAWVLNLVSATSQRMRQAAQSPVVEAIEATAGYQCKWCSRQHTCEASLAGCLTAQGSQGEQA